MELQALSGMVILFVTAAIILGVGATILSEVRAGQCTGGSANYNRTLDVCGNATFPYLYSTLASNSTGSGQTGVDTFGDWLPTIAVIIAAAVVIGVIVNYFRS